ncbi:butyrophilin subfamily 1 member A1 isoform X2 [Amyelois transitella]|uniref:butyrophilin subfamily 1 member A1 isoform X2 n=1 Tax=Amyelois transitella TaxID=680683 RepID=UPI00067ACA9A|nr:butyrophilin subfamily 1 member A1 isoform X2 [Amyelois transitella]
MLTVCGLLLSVLTVSHQLSIDEFEVPASVEVGSDVELRCGFLLDASDGRGEPYVKWWYTPLYFAEDRPIQLYQRMDSGNATYLRHSNIELVGKDDILLKDVKYTDSGRYECEVSGLNEKRVHADLIVFSNGTGPELNISAVEDGPDGDEEEDLLVECRADDVTPQPELVISANGRPVDGVIQYESSSGDGLYNVIANVTVTKSDLLDVEVRCELFFVNHNITHLPFVDIETYGPTGAASRTLSFWWFFTAAIPLLCIM